jgi:hypothetical protein
VNSYKGPDTRPLFGYSVNEPLARIVVQKQENQPIVGLNPANIANKPTIYRFSGPYEPIFKDINVFMGGFYYYTASTGTTITLDNTSCSGGNGNKTYNYTSPLKAPPPDPLNVLIWENLNAMCGLVFGVDNSIFNKSTPPVRIYTQVNVKSTTGIGERETEKIFVGGFNFGVIPPDAIISGITVTILRRAKNTDWGSLIPVPPDIYCYDNYIALTKDYTDVTKIFPVEAFSLTKCGTDAYWGPTMSQRVYPTDMVWYWGIDNPLWSTTWTPADLKQPNFGVIFGTIVNNNSPDTLIIPQIECITVCVTYTYNQTTYTYDKSVFMDNNLKFDTTLNDFGLVHELVYSKVNEKTSILKINPNRDTSMYPMIDEYGYTYSNRFIFKSSWDKEFFIRTNSGEILNYTV